MRKIRQSASSSFSIPVRLEGCLLAFFEIDGHRGIDKAVLVHTEEHGAIEAVALRKDLGEHRQGLLAAVFLVSCDEDDVLAFSRALAAFVGQPLLGIGHGRRGEKER